MAQEAHGRPEGLYLFLGLKCIEARSDRHIGRAGVRSGRGSHEGDGLVITHESIR